VLAQHVVIERSLERIAIAPLVRAHLNHVRSQPIRCGHPTCCLSSLG
jgi:hypothetical protein